MKRPLIVLAAGFVLGEVLALQYQLAVFPGLTGWLFAAGLVGIWSYGMWTKISVGKKQGSGAYRKALLLFFVLAVLGYAAGYGRGVCEKGRLDREEMLAGEFTGARCMVQGKIGSVEQGDGSLSVVLKGAQATAGKMTARFERVSVYVQVEAREDARKDTRERAETGVDTTGMRRIGDSRLLPGMTVEVRGKLELVEEPRNPGEFDFRTYYRSKGIACRMFGEQVRVIGENYVPYDTFLVKFRNRCAAILDRICLPEDSPIFKAVLLGETSGMEPEVRTMYQRHGISHLLAVSGQHLSIIGGGIYLLMRKLGFKYGKAGLLSAGLVISYGIMTGSSGSAIRAVIMILCLWLAAGEGRSYDTLSGLGLAAVLLLWKSPYLLFQSGFQLSFGAVLAIGGLGSWLKTEFSIEKGWQNTILMSLCVQIVITPVVLYHYYQHPLYGILLNLLVIPLISVLMYSGILGIGLGSVWTQGGIAAVGAGHYVLRLYEWLCRQVERLPGYCLVMGRPSWGQIVVYGGLMAGTLYVLGKWSSIRQRELENNRDDTKRGKRQWIRLLMAACFYGLCFTLLFPLPFRGMEIVMMDVGQGDGILMRTSRTAVLVDGGSSSEKKMGSKTAEPFLKSKGIDVIDYALVSHGDSDHISGLLYLLRESKDIRIRYLVLPEPGQGQAIYEELEQAARDAGSQVIYMGQGDCIQVEDISLTCVYAGGTTIKEDDRNTHSLVVCADYRNLHMLFTGDMGTAQEHELAEWAKERGSLQQIHLAHVQVLKTAHHGSDTSSSEEFLECVNPALAVVSYGRGNSYGHPSPDVIARMKNRRIPVMETGIGGAIILRTDGTQLDCGYFMKLHD